MQTAFVLLGLLAASAEAERPSFNWARIGTMPPEALTRELFGEVGRVMYLRPGQAPRGRGRLTLPLRALTFLTRPRASYRTGVCESDWVTVYFEPAPYALGPDPGMRPQRFEVSTRFIVQNLAKVREGGPSIEEMPALEAACAAIDPREVSTIIADTAFTITGTIGLLAQLIDAARQGRTTGPLECRDQNRAPVAEAQCLRDLARLRAERTYWASLSPGCDRREAGLYCQEAKVDDGGDGLTISFELRAGAKTPARIVVAPEPDLSAIQ